MNTIAVRLTSAHLYAYASQSRVIAFIAQAAQSVCLERKMMVLALVTCEL